MSRSVPRRPLSAVARRCARTFAIGIGLLCLAPVSAWAVSPPTGVHVKAVAQRTAAIGWTPVTGATGYTVYRNGSAITSLPGYSVGWVDDTGLSPSTSYAYSVAVTTGSGTSTASSAVTATTFSTSATVLTGCSSTPLTGTNYELGADFHATSTTDPCLTLASTHAAIDCKAHTITMDAGSAGAIALSNAANSFVVGCNVMSAVPQFVPTQSAIALNSSANAVVAMNQIVGLNGSAATPSLFRAAGSPTALISANTMNGGTVAINPGSDGLMFSYNNVENTTTNHVDTNLQVNSGNSVVIGGNAISNGDDDNIVLRGPSDRVVVSANTLSDAGDAAVEPVGVFTNGRITDNVIDGAGTAAIGEYWQTAFDLNNVLDNHVTNSARLFMFLALSGTGRGLPPGRSSFSLSGNRFARNTFTSPMSSTTPSAAFDMHNAAGLPTTNTAGNTIVFNQFGYSSPSPTVNATVISSASVSNQCPVVTPNPLHCS